MTAVTLSECGFLVENDYDYFRNDEEWIERLKYRALNDYEVSRLRKLMADLKTSTMSHINDLFVIGPLKFYFEKGDFAYVNRASTPLPPNASLTTATGLPYTASQDKFQVKAAFVATIIRYLILKDEDGAVAESDRQMFLSKYPFLGPQVGTAIELTWLNRFERSLRYLKRFIPAERNKILYLTVGNHLEGSTLYTTYITGGQNRPETERRVKIFDYLCQVQPRKRAKRVGVEGLDLPSLSRDGSATGLEEKMNSADISSSSRYNNNNTSSSAFPVSLLLQQAQLHQLQQQQRDQGNEMAGGKRVKRQYTKRVKLSADHNHHLPPHPSSLTIGAPLSLEEAAAGNALTLFQTMFSRQSSSSNESNPLLLSTSTTSSSSHGEGRGGGAIPYELSVLLAAVETQIKEEDVDLEECRGAELPIEDDENDDDIEGDQPLSPAKRALSYRSSRVSSSSSLLSHVTSSSSFNHHHHQENHQ